MAPPNNRLGRRAFLIRGGAVVAAATALAGLPYALRKELTRETSFVFFSSQQQQTITALQEHLFPKALILQVLQILVRPSTWNGRSQYRNRIQTHEIRLSTASVDCRTRALSDSIRCSQNLNLCKRNDCCAIWRMRPAGAEFGFHWC